MPFASDELIIDAPETHTIKYTGSKLKLLPFILSLTKKAADGYNNTAVFEEFRKGSSGKFIVIEAIEKLIELTPANYIILSYSSGGRATARELNEVLNAYGRIIETEKINYKKNVMSGMKWTKTIRHDKIESWFSN